MGHPRDNVSKLLLGQDSVELDRELLHTDGRLERPTIARSGLFWTGVVVFGDIGKVTIFVECPVVAVVCAVVAFVVRSRKLQRGGRHDWCIMLFVAVDYNRGRDTWWTVGGRCGGGGHGGGGDGGNDGNGCSGCAGKTEMGLCTVCTVCFCVLRKEGWLFGKGVSFFIFRAESQCLRCSGLLRWLVAASSICVLLRLYVWLALVRRVLVVCRFSLWVFPCFAGGVRWCCCCCWGTLSCRACRLSRFRFL